MGAGEALGKWWAFKQDGSLRGGNAVEAVSHPLKGTMLVQGVRKLCKAMEQPRDPFGFRCSTHLHMNLLDMDIKRIPTLALLSLLADNLFFQAGGGERRINYNCRPASLVADEVDAIAQMCFGLERGNDQPPQLLNERNRYLGTNWAALYKFGTVEYRHFPGCRDAATILWWVELCSNLYTAAEKLTVEDVLACAEKGPEAFIHTVFGEMDPRLAYQEWEQDWEETLETTTQFIGTYDAMEGNDKTLHGFLKSEYIIQ